MIKISNVIEIQIKLPRSIVTTKLVGEFLNVVLLFSYKTFDDNLN